MATLGDIIRRHGQVYLARHGPAMPIAHRRVLALLGACRTGALGRVRWHCDGCGRSHRTPRSCGNRHCPECRAAKNDAWLGQQSARRLDAPYFLLTFTLPEKLRPFARSHQCLAYAALFRAASRALQKPASVQLAWASPPCSMDPGIRPPERGTPTVCLEPGKRPKTLPLGHCARFVLPLEWGILRLTPSPPAFTPHPDRS